MRIISGKAGGIHLEAPEGRGVRPTEDRVKESMFSALGDLTDKVVVDLFSGTGALGLEALSRGAAKVILVEKSREHISYIEKNLLAVRKAMGAECGETEILSCDVRQCHRQLIARQVVPDIVIADPPYHVSVECPYCGAELLKDAEFARWATFPVLLCLEHGSDTVMPWHPLTPWKLLKTRAFGIRAVSYAKRLEEEK